MKRDLVTLSGRVQGVGFRDYVTYVARHFPVAGTVRNVRDGARVEIDAEGRAEDVDAFVAAVIAGAPPPARIDDVRRVPAVPRGATGFRREASV